MKSGRTTAFLGGTALGALVGAALTLYVFAHVFRQDNLASEVLRVINGTSRSVDFSLLERGRWRALCIFGPYEQPRNVLMAFMDRHRIDRPSKETGPKPPDYLDQSAAFAALIDESGELRWANLSGRVNVADQWSSRCVLRTRPMLEIPVNGRD